MSGAHAAPRRGSHAAPARWRTWALPGSLLALAVVAGALALRSDAVAEAAPAPATPSAATPAFSARRVPEVVAAPLATRALRASLEPLAAGLGPDACLTVAVGSRPVLEVNPSTGLIPASNQKVRVAAAALALLDHDQRFRTEVRAGAAPAGGVVEGDLFVVGSGDPLLATEAYARFSPRRATERTSYDQLADNLVAAGVREVRGGVVGDERRYDRERVIPSWPSNYVAEQQVGPLSALSVDDGWVLEGGGLRPADDPAASAAATLKALLEARGVRVAGEARSGEAPADAAVLASVESVPLVEVVGQMLADSDNNTAELLTKELGVQTSGEGTTAAGLAAVTAALGAEGLVGPADAFTDGSGLDRGNRLTCTGLVAILGRAGPASPLGQGLAVAGETGTLAARYRDTPVEGRLLAKTGSLREVSSLAGFVTAAASEPITFAVVLNGADGADPRGRELTDALVEQLGRYPDAPAASELGPAPPVAP